MCNHKITVWESVNGCVGKCTRFSWGVQVFRGVYTFFVGIQGQFMFLLDQEWENGTNCAIIDSSVIWKQLKSWCIIHTLFKHHLKDLSIKTWEKQILSNKMVFHLNIIAFSICIVSYKSLKSQNEHNCHCHFVNTLNMGLFVIKTVQVFCGNLALVYKFVRGVYQFFVGILSMCTSFMWENVNKIFENIVKKLIIPGRMTILSNQLMGNFCFICKC